MNDTKEHWIIQLIPYKLKFTSQSLVKVFRQAIHIQVHLSQQF